MKNAPQRGAELAQAELSETLQSEERERALSSALFRRVEVPLALE